MNIREMLHNPLDLDTKISNLKKILKVSHSNLDITGLSWDGKMGSKIFGLKCNIHPIPKKTWEPYLNNLLKGCSCPSCGNDSTASRQRNDFIGKSKTKHGENRFDYSKCVYKKCKEKVILICIKHREEFTCTPPEHLTSEWGCCPSCRKENTSGENHVLAVTLEELKERIRIIWGDRFKYDFTGYTCLGDTIKITCDECNRSWSSTATNHISQPTPNGCITCGRKVCADKLRMPLEEFIKRANLKHNNKYIYNKFLYNNNQTKSFVTCKEHGDYPITPVDHLEGIGCKSCEHPDITMTHSDQVKLWDYHKNGDDNPKNYTSGSAKKVWWICLTNCKFGCSHTHLQSINSKCGNRNTGCPYCCIPRKQSCIHDRISTTHPEVAKQWHPTLNGYKKADDFTFGSSYQAYWQCPKNINHTWKTYISSRCRLRVGCPDCRNKTEAKLLDFLKKHYPDIFTQLKLESCKNITYLPLDFCIPSLKIIIELDGIQHFKQVSNWASPEESIQRDIYKMKQAEAEGYKIIRIFQEDVYDNDETWLETHLLPEIKSSDRNHMFISSIEDLYDEHIRVYDTT